MDDKHIDLIKWISQNLDLCKLNEDTWREIAAKSVSWMARAADGEKFIELMDLAEELGIDQHPDFLI